jgi:hypothetical protein
MNDFVVFRVLWDSIRFTEQAAELICSCLNWYVKRSGKSLDAVEKCLTLYKLKMETKL